MATAISSARPPGAAIAWATRDGIFVEFPTKAGPSYVTRFPATPEGLRTALNILLEHPAPTHRTVVLDHPAVRRPKPQFDDAERGKVRDILKGLKVI